MIIDIHTHIFPDKIAKTAIPHLEMEGDVEAFLDGTEIDLLRSMDLAGITKSVVCSIATKPAQFQSIFTWSEQIRSGRLVPFPSIHPDDPNCLAQLEQIKKAGFKGIKMHPYYQSFSIDEERLNPLYALLDELGLALLMHTGYDIAFPRIRLADPAKILKVSNLFPKLKLVTSHLGAWDQWQEVREILTGKPVYMDISYSLELLDTDTAKDLILNHPADYILFGSDSPWAGQSDTINLLKRLALPKELERKILGGNALALLGL